MGCFYHGIRRVFDFDGRVLTVNDFCFWGQTVSEQKTHSKLGASSYERWSSCLGSVNLCSKLPPAPESPYAKEGTAAHMLAEKVFSDTPNAFYYRNKEIGGVKVTEEMAEGVQMFVDHVREIKNESGGELFIEKKFHLSHLHPDLFGTADAVIVQPFGKIWVFDFKYGAGVPVEAHKNKQLLYYGLGATYGEDFSELTITIVQPRAEHKDGPIRSYTASPEELVEFSKELRSKAIQTQQKDAPLVPKQEHCRWCPANAVCPALHKKALETAKMDFADPGAVKEVTSLTPQEIAKVIENKKLIEDWLASVERHALMQLLEGKKIDGLKIVAGRANRVWNDEGQASKVLIERLGDDAFERKLLSVAKAEKALGKDAIVDLFSHVVSGYKVAHESDRRRAVTPPNQDFSRLLDFDVKPEDF